MDEEFTAPKVYLCFAELVWTLSHRRIHVVHRKTFMESDQWHGSCATASCVTHEADKSKDVYRCSQLQREAFQVLACPTTL
ncbi:hypothetical protein GOP47_0002942 [Adiantum capillus-veneris]|uniref:Uncharacterized protein n=1 Tax=Adiantum capillus-veneris TaxID=13818 RepID=A0A9D4ZPM4_ADICA|nr:hypothetical protein GOP47_0002942 [Adiantum capillus-veneris]